MTRNWEIGYGILSPPEDCNGENQYEQSNDVTGQITGRGVTFQIIAVKNVLMTCLNLSVLYLTRNIVEDSILQSGTPNRVYTSRCPVELV
ncbi:hypothetical protein J6590_027740 [Homalodisca vitripennis]|nr:hypothetical protein J6590_027740 [Homalodisca vitripennis]